jgi:hypothetical protein
MTPLFVPMGSPPPPRTLSVDAGIAGAAAVYSHWQGERSPPELAADTSTGILCNAARDPGSWFAGFDHAANNHVDADGLLSLAVACRPDLAAQAPLLIAAAEAGDFCHWPGEAGFRLMLRLHQHILACADGRGEGQGWEDACCRSAVADIDRLIAEAQLSETARDAEVARVLATADRLRCGDGFRCEDDGRLRTIAWQRVHGHPADQFSPLAVGRPDDLPVWAIHAAFPDVRWQLLAEQGSQGTSYRLEAPRHSWAKTSVLTGVAWPDCSPVAHRLAALGGTAWLARPQAARLGLTCVLASDGPSPLTVAVVADAVRQVLA